MKAEALNIGGEIHGELCAFGQFPQADVFRRLPGGSRAHKYVCFKRSKQLPDFLREPEKAVGPPEKRVGIKECAHLFPKRRF